MSNSEEVSLRADAVKSIERMQTFEVDSMPQAGRLGELSFAEAVEPTKRLIGLYRQLTLTALDDIPTSGLKQLRDQANADYNRLQEMLKFTLNQQDAPGVRQRLITNVEGAYEPAFNRLSPFVSYSTSKSADFKRLEAEARAMIQNVSDKADELTRKLQEDKKSSADILADIRKVAGEQGVSQQAVYFKEAAIEHEAKAEEWRQRTTKLAILLGIYAVLSLFLHRIPGIAPENTYQTVQLAVSKVLIFAVISYMLYLATRNYLANKHNAVVNKHRQNALMTYRTISDAAKDFANKEVILTHASACIFGPQATGYASAQGQEATSARSVVELLTNTMGGESK